jgi:hypothetical protein
MAKRRHEPKVHLFHYDEMLNDLGGQQPEGMTLPGLMEPFPVEWEWQQAAIPIAPSGPLTAKC